MLRYGIANWQVGRNCLWVKKLVELGYPILFMIHGKGICETGPEHSFARLGKHLKEKLEGGDILAL